MAPEPGEPLGRLRSPLLRRLLPRRVLFWTAVAVAVALVVWQGADLWRPVGAWWRGALTGDSVVWGLRLRYWGRIGKLLQFVAGATVVLKLIGPERLTAWSEGWAARRGRALARAERVVAGYPLAALREAMRDSLVYRHVHHELGDETTPPPSEMLVARTGPPAVGEAAVDQGEVDAWHAEAAAALRTAHGCAEPHGERACDGQVAFARRAADDFLRARVPDGTWEELTGSAERALEVRRGFLSTIAFLLGLPVLVLLWAAFRHKAGLSVPPWWVFALCLVSMLLSTVVMVVVQDTPPTSTGLVRVAVRLRTAPVVALTRLVAAALVRARPGHAVEWFAFAVFLVGFGLDFLAS